MKNQQVKNLLVSIGICCYRRAIDWRCFRKLVCRINHPWFSLPLWVWYIVGALYYNYCHQYFVSLSNLTPSPQRTTASCLTMAMIAANEFWNYLFFGLKSTFAGLIPFTLLVLKLFITFRKWQPTTAWILFPYILWLGYVWPCVGVQFMELKQID